MQLKTEQEQLLQLTIGKNLKTARQHVADMSMREVMIKVWGISNSKNRLSEIENGSRMPSPFILLRLSLLYGVSLDYIFGVSSDIERDLESSRAGRITQGLREIAIDLVDKIGDTLAKQVSVLPRMEAVTLKDKSLQMVYLLRKVECNEKGISPEDFDSLIELSDSIEDSCKLLDRAVAKHQRIMELSVFDHIERTDNQLINKYLTDHRIHLDKPVEVAMVDKEGLGALNDHFEDAAYMERSKLEEAELDEDIRLYEKVEI
ncbi:helix-turn-helix transcriptional regulator [Acinetobacter pittii]|uniref:helix-turn-helix domain-containing protein n=1 Tax=Acinetobacter pittii TaxID=48296 RepID=UPI0021CD3A05|nr:helix-turn-helix transcriptional regulator [Acinetobacter pittii]MCU4334777.1 helix-turn-helix domain-containing protein [Acinetobacter pittii]